MGIELLTLAVAVAGTVAQASAARKAAKAEATANVIDSAAGEVRDLIARRRLLREERQNRSRLLNASEATGTGGSSGLAGSLSALSVHADEARASQAGQQQASRGISAALQRRANAQTQGAVAGSLQNLATKGIGIVDDSGILA